jgi:hypothetical protein
VRIIGAAPGNIMAAIMTSQIVKKGGPLRPIVGEAIAIPSAFARCQKRPAQANTVRARSKPKIMSR